MNPRLAQYCDEILRFRRALNLTAIADRPTLEARMIQPSLALTRWMPARGTLLDVGSGMGIPGIPILIACPGLNGVLVERRKKRAEFLRHVVRTLALDAIVLDRDIRQLPPLAADVCVARAVADQVALLAMVRMHVRCGGRAVLPVPRDSEAVAIAGWRPEVEEVVDAGGESQCVRCYTRLDDGIAEEVSRET